MAMANPPHPGELIMEALEGRDVTVADLVKCLKVDPEDLQRVVQGQVSVTPDMAYRLGKCLGTSTELWLRLQMHYDIWQVEHGASQPEIASINSLKD